MNHSDTKTAILDAAQELIQTRGMNAMSYRDIANIINIRTASIHYHFPSKEDLVQALIERYHQHFIGLVDSILQSKASATTKLNRFGDLFVDTLESGSNGKVCLCGMLGAELATLGSPMVKNLRRFYRENAKRLAEIIDEGRSNKELNPRGDSLILATIMFSLLEGAMLVVRADGGVTQFKQIWKTFLQLVKP